MAEASTSPAGDHGFRELSRTVRADESGVRIGEATVRAPDGTIVRRRYLHTPDVVAIVAVHEDNVLLLREYRAAVGQEVVQLPMGKVPAGQDPLSCAHAELMEETGFEAGRCEPVGTLLACPGWMNQVLHVYHATGLNQLSARPESDDPDDVEERQSTVFTLPVTDFGHAVSTGLVRDARTIAAVRLALG
jgi:ADP-ribose pyrophosphatase